MKNMVLLTLIIASLALATDPVTADPNEAKCDAITGSGDAICFFSIDFDTDLTNDDVTYGYRFDSATQISGTDLINALTDAGLIECDYTNGAWGAYITRFASEDQDFTAVWGTEAQQWWGYYNSVDGENYSSSWVGAGSRTLTDGDWDKWVFTVEGTSDFGLWVTDAYGEFDGSTYKNLDNIIGKPTVSFYDSWSGNTEFTKVVNAPYGDNALVTVGADEYIVVKFDHKVMNDVQNPYGIDFLVFGNAFYNASGAADNSSDMGTFTTNGSIFSEDVKVSVSQDGINWYQYSEGPFADGEFPTQGYHWSQVKFAAEGNGWTDIEIDFTQPVDPSIKETLLNGSNVTVASVIAAYGNSGGGTGFDLTESGYDWIKYVKVESAGGEIDAIADVTHCGDAQHPAPAGDVTGDCRVDLADFAQMASGWLSCTWSCQDLN